MDLAKRIVAKFVGISVSLLGVLLTFVAFQNFFMSFSEEPLSFTLVLALVVVAGIGLIVGGQWVGNAFDDKPPPTPPE